MAKEHGIQWQLNRRYHLTCTSGHLAAQFNWHGNCAAATVDTVVLHKFQAACVSKITVELTSFCAANRAEYNVGCFGCLTDSGINRSHSVHYRESLII